MMAFTPIIAGIVIGIMAQAMKGRTGAGWGLMTIVLGYGAWYVLRSAVGHNDPMRLVDPAFRDATFIGAAVAAAVVMGLVVLTLPRARPAAAEDADGDRVPCPHCAEKIQPLAKVCRFCGRDVAPAATADADMRHYLG